MCVICADLCNNIKVHAGNLTLAQAPYLIPRPELTLPSTIICIYVAPCVFVDSSCRGKHFVTLWGQHPVVDRLTLRAFYFKQHSLIPVLTDF